MFNWDQATPEERVKFLKRNKVYHLCSGLEDYTLGQIEEAGEMEAYLIIDDAIHFGK